MTGRVKGKTAIVTGGANGMGAAESTALAREGANVVVVDVLEDRGIQHAAALEAEGANVMFMRADITSESDWQVVFEKTVERFGRVDILVNNAGISARGMEFDNIDSWHKLLNVNVLGAVIGTKHAVRQMRSQGTGGSIVNVASISAFVGDAGNHPGYHSSKGAVVTFTRSAAVHYAKDGIRVNAVHPGFMPRMWFKDSRQEDPTAEEFHRENIKLIPMGRIGRVDEVANAVLFLASDEASYITGTDLVVDGGFLAR